MRNPRPQTMSQSVQVTKTSSPGTSSDTVMRPTLQQTLKETGLIQAFQT